MKINHLQLQHFRNYPSLVLQCDPHINLFFGENGQGKTNLVEAIAYCSLASSFRGDDDSDLIQIGEPFASIEANIELQTASYRLKMVLTKSGRKLWINEVECKRLSDFLEIANVVTFVPSDVLLFKESPKVRRDLLDNELTKLSPSYGYALSQYQQLLKQRNELLKQNQVDELLLQVLDEQLATTGIELITKRSRFLSKLEIALHHKYRLLSDRDVTISIQYQTFLKDQEWNQETYLATLQEHRDDDRSRGVSQYGPHRDDFTVLVDQLPLSSYGSQGQQRVGVIALKLCLVDLAYEHTGEAPIIVLDDLFSELDQRRQRQVLQHLQTSNQLFLTTSDRSVDTNLFDGVSLTKYEVVQGTLR